MINKQIIKGHLNTIIFCDRSLEFYMKLHKIKKEIDFIKLYTSVISSWINNYLRFEKKTCSCKDYIINCINENLNISKKYNNKTVYRMEDHFEENFLGNLDLNNNIEIPFLLSTSKNNWENRKFTIEIKTLKQSKSVDLELLGIFSSEQEVLFPTNSKFKLLSSKNNYIKMEEIK